MPQFQRGVFRFMMLVAVCVPPLASGRRLHEHEGQALELEGSASKNAMLQEAMLDEKSLSAETVSSRGGPTKIDVEKKILIRECVGERAEDWPELQRRLGHTAHTPENTTNPLELVATVYEIDDQLQARSESRSTLESILHPSWSSSNVAQWEEEKEKALNDLDKWGFDFDQAWKRCAKGATNDAYTCMVNAAEGAPLQQKVRRRIDLKDFVMQLRSRRYFWNAQGEKESVLWDEIEQLDAELKAAGYNRKEIKKSCRKRMTEEVASVKKRVFGELSAGQNDEEGHCHENPDKMCPEGTYATNARRWDHVKGAAVMGTTFLVAKFTLLPIGTAIGTAVAGPAGATAGFLAGNALVTPIAMAAGYWASRGPLECACFPRKCEFDTHLGVCHMDNKVESKNPFSSKLPMSGMKCALKYKTEDKCSLQQCTKKDYEYGTLSGSKLFGIVGNHDKNLYNCLSTSRTQYDTLAGVPVLPDGQNNTIAERNKILTEVLKPASNASDISDKH